MPVDLKKVVRDVFAEWAIKTRDDTLIGRGENEDKALLEKAGKICTEFSATDKAKMAETTLKLHAAWVQSQGGRVAEVWEIVKPILAR